MVLVHGLLLILDSWPFSPVEVRRWAGRCTMGESRLTSSVEISHQVSRRHGDRYGESKDTSTKFSNIPSLSLFSASKLGGTVPTLVFP